MDEKLGTDLKVIEIFHTNKYSLDFALVAKYVNGER